MNHIRRGYRRCSSCGQTTPQRAKNCQNNSCALNKMMIPFDPVKLVTNNGISIYSLRKKERYANPRNFVKINNGTESTAANIPNVYVCYICNLDPTKSAYCPHIVAVQKNNIPQAQPFSISFNILWSLNIPNEQKERLWNIYREDEQQQQIPAIQRLNPTLFAVKCTNNASFPAGLLHVTLNNTKKGMIHSCACRKLKIILEPDNSVVMEEEICDHLLLVLAAVLSECNGQTLYYSNFTNLLKSLWTSPTISAVPSVVNDPNNSLLDLNGSIDDKTDINGSADDIFSFNENFLSDENIPDLADFILDALSSDEIFAATGPQTTPSKETDLFQNVDSLYPCDPSLMSSYNDLPDDDTGIHLSAQTDTLPITTHIELTDCNIELMDQFHQLTDQIDLNSEDIILPNSLDSSISVLPQPFTVPIPPTQMMPVQTAKVVPVLSTTDATSLLLPSNNQIKAPTSEPPPLIEMPTIAVVKKASIKASDIITEVKSRKSNYLPAKRALIVNTVQDSSKKSMDVTDGSEPALAFSAWLDYVIEIINESVYIEERPDVSHTFHVHEEIFAHFSKSFSIGIKRRMPNSQILIKTGRHKGLTKYTWYFPIASTVRRIFSTKNNSIEIERAFVCDNDGCFVPYKQKPDPIISIAGKHKRIYPKISIYKAFIDFECNNNTKHETGFRIEWLPNVFPKSHYGILKIEFSVGCHIPTINAKDQLFLNVTNKEII